MSTIQQIQQASRGGFVRVDSGSGQLVTAGRGFRGRVVAWIRGKLSPDTVRQENRAAINAFVAAIGSDSKYGVSLAGVAARKLDPLIEQGKPLRERTVRQVLGEVEGERDRRLAANRQTADRFSRSGVPGDADGFDALWSEASARLGHSLDASAAGVGKLREQIRDAVLAASDGGKHEVSVDAAREMARERVDRFADALAGELDALAAADLAPEDKARVADLLKTDPDPKPGLAVKYANGMRAQTIVNSGEFKDMMTAAAGAHGLGAHVEAMDLEAVNTTPMLLKATAGDNLLSGDELRDAMRAAADEFMARKAEVMDHVDQVGLDEPGRAALRRILAGAHEFRTPEQVEVLVGVARAYEGFCDRVTAGSAGDMASAFTEFQRGFDAAYEPLFRNVGDEGLHADDVMPYMDKGLSLWVAMQDDSKKPAMRQAYNALAGEQGSLLADSAAYLAEPERAGASAGTVQNVARRLENVRMKVAEEIYTRLDLDKSKSEVAKPRQGDPANIAGESEVPDGVYAMYRDLGVNVALPDPVGRSRAEAFGARFQERCLDSLNDAFRSPGSTTDGIATSMRQDFGRATFRLGGERISYSGSSTGATAESIRESAARDFSAWFGDDEAGKWAVSQIAHQGTLASVIVGLHAGLGPFDGLPVPGGSTRPEFNISRTPDGGYLVQASTSMPLSGLAREGGTEVDPTDPEASRFAYNIAYTISRESIDAGRPQAELVGPVTYEYTISR